MSECNKLCSINQTEVRCSTNQMYETDRQSSFASSQDNEGKVFHPGIHYGYGCLYSFPSHSCRSIQSSCRHTDPGQLENLSVDTQNSWSSENRTAREERGGRRNRRLRRSLALNNRVRWVIFRLTFSFCTYVGFCCCCCLFVFNIDTKFFWLRIFYLET